MTRGHRGPIVDKLTNNAVMFFVQNVSDLLKTRVVSSRPQALGARIRQPMPTGGGQGKYHEFLSPGRGRRNSRSAFWHPQAAPCPLLPAFSEHFLQ